MIAANLAIIILAAGMGTRMKSNKAKVLHEILGIPMILYVVETARRLAGDNVIIVVGNQAEAVRSIVSTKADLIYAYQENQLGTGHAVACALPHIPADTEHVVILYGDVPLISPATISGLVRDHLDHNRDVSVLATDVEDPTRYGRILLDADGRVTAIVEESDASEAQKRINTINTGIYCIKNHFLHDAIPKIQADNVQGEFYLTDIIEIAYRARMTIGMRMTPDPVEVAGINTLQELQRVERILGERTSNKP